MPRSVTIGAIAAVVLMVAGGIGYLSLGGRPTPTASSHAQRCDSKPAMVAALFSDDETTLIRLSNPDLSGLRILRREPAGQLPGMFDSLLALSLDSTTLAYVTAGNVLMDDAHIWAIDTTHPELRQELARVPSGFWPERPAWSPDKRKLAFVTVDEAAGASGGRSFRLWATDLDKPLPNASPVTELSAGDFTSGRASIICWSSNDQPTLVDSTGKPLALPSPKPSASSPSEPEPSPTPSAQGTPCGVPIFSQNDPVWRHQIMAAGGDSIGGYGCALTSTTMMLNYYGASLTPAELSTCLGAYADPLYWGKAPECTKGIAKGGSMTPFSWSELDSILGRGDPAIVGVIRGQTGSHYVVVTSGAGQVSSGYSITDPWDASTTKTLGNYVLTGYNPAWIITYSGSERHCNRTVSTGIAVDLPRLTGVTDGGAYNHPVDVGGGGGGNSGGKSTPSPGSSPVQLKPYGGSIYLTTLSPSIWELIHPVQLPSPSPTSQVINTPWPQQPLLPGKIISTEGIYLLSASSSKGISYLKFTVDLTPPIIDVTLLNQALRAYQPPDGGPPMAAERPRLKKIAKFRIASKDNLSGVRQVEWHIDGEPYKDYSNNTTSQPVVSETRIGDHTLFTRAIDMAGNTSAEVKFDFTVYDDPPPAAAPPPPPPVSRPPSPPPPPPPGPPPAWSVGPNPLVVTGRGSNATVTNPVGAAPISITGFSTSIAGYNIDYELSTCQLRPPTRLEPGKSCTIHMRWNGGQSTARLTVMASDGTSRQIDLRGQSSP